MTSRSGTNTSSRKSSAKAGLPSRRPTGRTVTPSASSGNIRYVSPRCGRSASGSLRNSPKARSAKAARDDQAFWPLSSQPPSVRTAVERSEARSEPDSGSDQACAQTTSPRAMAGRTRARCSAVPCSNSVGASRLMPFWLTRPGAPAAKYSSSKTSQRRIELPRPPYSSGQDTTDQRSAASAASHSRWAANPSAVSRDGSGAGGTWSASQSRTSVRNAPSDASKSRSISRPPSSSPGCPCRRARRSRSRRCARAPGGGGRRPSPSRCAAPGGPLPG